MLEIVPITLREANAYVDQHHRTHGSVRGQKFSIGVSNNAKIVGVVIVSRPVNRVLDDSWTVEVTRCCTDGTPNACSKLYAAAWRAARSMGYKRLVTYTKITEPGTSLIASGFKVLHQVQGRTWNCDSRPRVDTNPKQDKLCWGIE